MSDSEKQSAPTQTVELSPADRINLVNHFLPLNAQSREQMKAVSRLRGRLVLEKEVQVVRNEDGTVVAPPSANGRYQAVEFEFTDGELSLLDLGLRQREEKGTLPTSEPAVDLLRRLEGLIETVRNRSEETAPEP